MKTVFIKCCEVTLQYVTDDDVPVKKRNLEEYLSLSYPQISSYYLCSNGKTLNNCETLSDGDVVYLCHRLPGGKGGFGSMLRAIGAQIEKTTNREACRDLSGRRLRDINEEMRLKKWIAKQAEDSQNKDAAKIANLEKKLQVHKHDFSDPTYDKIRSEIPEKVNDAIAQGLANAKSGEKRSAPQSEAPRKKPKVWMMGLGSDLEDEDLSSSSEDEATKKEDKKNSSSEQSEPQAGTSKQMSEKDDDSSSSSKDEAKEKGKKSSSS